MDLITVFGLLIGVSGILVGNFLEGGHLSSLLQLTAAFIVFGGTGGAVLISSTREDLRVAWRLLKSTFKNQDDYLAERVKTQIIESSQIARREGVVILEGKINTYVHPYMQTVFRFMIDGVDTKQLQEIFEKQLEFEEEYLDSGARVFNDAGGFAPTIGIIGAILGLIHIMNNLTDTSKLGAGIAVAFVATIYGVGSANLVFIPIANKIRRRISSDIAIKKMILAGALGVVNGLNPYVLEQKLISYIPEADVNRI